MIKACCVLKPAHMAPLVCLFMSGGQSSRAGAGSMSSSFIVLSFLYIFIFVSKVVPRIDFEIYWDRFA